MCFSGFPFKLHLDKTIFILPNIGGKKRVFENMQKCGFFYLATALTMASVFFWTSSRGHGVQAAQLYPCFTVCRHMDPVCSLLIVHALNSNYEDDLCSASHPFTIKASVTHGLMRLLILKRFIFVHTWSMS